jgi:DGQHR domain-containing protein
MFLADGQHRTAAIMEALKEDRERLRQQKVPVVILRYKNKEQVRQHFSDLNLNAKPASQTAGWAFEGRDPLAVATKRVAKMAPLFNGRVNELTNSLSKKTHDVITLGTLVQAHEALWAVMYPTKGKGMPYNNNHEDLTAIRQTDPMDPKVTPVADRLREVWEVAIANIPEWEGVLADKIQPRELRDGDESKGTKGYVFANGIGWQAIALVAAALIRHRPDDWSEELARCLRAVDWHKGPHWNGIAMIGDRVNNTGPGVKATAGYLLEKGGFKPEDGVAIKGHLEALSKSRLRYADRSLIGNRVMGVPEGRCFGAALFVRGTACIRTKNLPKIPKRRGGYGRSDYNTL